jgi:RNA polymerase sigma-70 factor (ECF subfamily)
MGGDEELLVRSVGDPSAFEPLVERLGPAVHAYLTRRSGRAADDLLAEVWLAAFASRSTFDPVRGGVRGWLFGIARHTLFAHHRLAHHRRCAADEGGVGVSGPDEPDWAGVDERLDAVAAGPALKEALAALPRIERELLLLVAWEQLTPSEAAQVLGIPAGTARSRLHRARAGMRERLAAVTQVPGETKHERGGNR